MEASEYEQTSKFDYFPKTKKTCKSKSEVAKFTKRNLSHVNQQLLLDEESHTYTTINICKGLFIYMKLPYRISSNLGIFQWIMEIY